MADVRVPLEWLENYARSIRDLDEISRSFLVDALYNTDLSNADAVVATMQAICETSGEAATEMSVQFYRGLSMLQTGQDMTKRVPYARDKAKIRAATLGIVNDAADEADLVGQLSDRLSYETGRAAKMGMWRAGQADDRDVRYARVPVGEETCAWCIMTAGLGFWYMTEEAASHTHSHCDCVLVPSIGRGSVRIDGYDSDEMRDMWRTANKMRVDGNIPDELAERIGREKAAKGAAYREDTNGTLAVMRWMYGLK